MPGISRLGWRFSSGHTPQDGEEWGQGRGEVRGGPEEKRWQHALLHVQPAGLNSAHHGIQLVKQGHAGRISYPAPSWGAQPRWHLGLLRVLSPEWP